MVQAAIEGRLEPTLDGPRWSSSSTRTVGNRRASSKAAEAEVMRTGGPLLRNEPNLLLSEIGAPLRTTWRPAASSSLTRTAAALAFAPRIACNKPRTGSDALSPRAPLNCPRTISNGEQTADLLSSVCASFLQNEPNLLSETANQLNGFRKLRFLARCADQVFFANDPRKYDNVT